MTILPRDSTEETGWGHADDTPYPCELFALPLNMNRHTSTLQRPSKLLMTSHVSLFDLLPTGILRILKFGYPDSNIVINSSTPYYALKLCVTPLSSKSLTIYGSPITILEDIGTTKNITIGYIDVFWLSTMVLGHAMNITQKNQDTPPR